VIARHCRVTAQISGSLCFPTKDHVAVQLDERPNCVATYNLKLEFSHIAVPSQAGGTLHTCLHDYKRVCAGFWGLIVRKRQCPFEGSDDKILALYSRGLSTRNIDAHLEKIYGVRSAGS
jgi:hypothetical protein